ncbi:MAG: cyclase family protein [Candidatus Bathyarchaeota archaeon]|nr:cyclase family protein [Candidatus Bathyarchaeota archaeon]
MFGRIVDLTHVIEPTSFDAERKFVVHIHDALEEVPGTVRPEGEWYVMSDVELMDHVGTHIEAPLHCLKDGMDLSQISLEKLIGDAVILDLRDVYSNSGVTLEQLRKAVDDAGGMRKNDIVFCMMGKTQYFSTEAIRWLVDAGMKLMGVDSTGVEIPQSVSHTNENHLALFRADIPLIERLANLDKLSKSRVKVYALPIPVVGLDAFPLRVIAIED